MKRNDLKKFDIPEAPGVYQFMDGKKILYIGRATSLRDRVRSYFSNDLIAIRGPLIVDMVFMAKKITWTQTDSILEAIILEANLIKKHQPYYNTKEKDNKSFYSVVITDEVLPRIFVERNRVLQTKSNTERGYKAKYEFGPFPSGSTIREALKIIRKIFPFRNRGSNLEHHKRFYEQLGLEPGTGNSVAEKKYQENVKHIVRIFQGRKKYVIGLLKKEMMIYAKKQLFEQAGKVKRQIYALEHIRDISLIKDDAHADVLDNTRIEAYDIAHISGKHMVGVMTVVDDRGINKKEYRTFTIRSVNSSNDTGALTEVLQRRLKHPEWSYPNIIVMDGGTAQLRVGQKIIREVGLSKTIKVVSVVKNEKHKPKALLGAKKIIEQYKKQILLANHESHRFALATHRKKRRKMK